MYESIDKKDKSHWFAYINVVINNCMAPTEEDAPVTHVTKECHDNKVISTLKTDEFKERLELQVDWDHYNDCVSK